jgi:hypothetical protein
MSDRPPVPEELQRRLMIEAGHRCAIPTCRVIGPLEIEHIDDWAKVRTHEFENMIVLCANCHGRKGDRRGQIDRKSLRQYKANLAVINSRYSDVERRVLEVLAFQREHMPAEWNPRGLAIQIPGTLRLMMMYLVKDGYVEIAPAGTRYLSTLDGENFVRFVAQANASAVVPDIECYRLTDAGVAFLDAWLGAQPLDADEG